MNKNLTAQNRLDKICYQRIQSAHFASPSLKIKLITLLKNVGGAK
jgi:hypothetical protein